MNFVLFRIVFDVEEELELPMVVVGARCLLDSNWVIKATKRVDFVRMKDI